MARGALQQGFTVTHTDAGQQGSGDRELQGVFVSEGRRPGVVVVSADRLALETPGEQLPREPDWQAFHRTTELLGNMLRTQETEVILEYGVAVRRGGA